MAINKDTIPHNVSWTEVHRDTKHLVRKLIKKGPWNGIVALTRGGLVPASILAREMEIRVVDTLCISTYEEQLKGTVKVLKVPEHAAAVDGEGWLLVDDLVDTGTTARRAKKILPKSHFATVYAKPLGLPEVNTFVSEVAQNVWVFFPWDTEPQYIPPLVEKNS